MTKETLKCPHCGSQEDVVKRIKYVGGIGDINIVACRDETKCWARWDEQNMVGKED